MAALCLAVPLFVATRNGETRKCTGKSGTGKSPGLDAVYQVLFACLRFSRADKDVLSCTAAARSLERRRIQTPTEMPAPQITCSTGGHWSGH
jgi:hypothetical protein